MKRADLEQLLSTDAGRQQFVEQAKDALADSGTHDLRADATALRRVRDDLRLFPTAAEIASNDGDFAVHTAQSLEMSFHVEGIRDEAPERAISWLIRQRRSGDATSAAFLVSMINRIASKGELQSDAERHVDAAIAALDEEAKPEAADTGSASTSGDAE